MRLVNIETAAHPEAMALMHYVHIHTALRMLQKLLNHPTDGLLVKLELAILCDVGAVITRATYALESDTPMIEKVVMICDRSSRGLYAVVAALGSL